MIFDRPSRDLARQSVQAVRDKKPEEAARLRAQSDELHQKSNAVRAAHNARILPAVTAILNEYTNSYVSPEVAVNIVINDNERSAAGKEKLQISGVPLAFADGKEITMWFGKVAPQKRLVVWAPSHGRLGDCDWRSRERTNNRKLVWKFVADDAGQEVGRRKPNASRDREAFSLWVGGISLCETSGD